MSLLGVSSECKGIEPFPSARGLVLVLSSSQYLNVVRHLLCAR
jgi:hypothetical protein